jgi:CheY-like chemotaxis protein
MSGTCSAEKARTAGVLCIDGNDTSAQDLHKSLEDFGCEVRRARDETEAVETLKLLPVDVVLVDSRFLNAGTARAVANIKNLRPGVRVVLSSDSGVVPAVWQKLVDVVIHKADFARRGRWLLDELRDVHFPFFTEWFDDWKRRRSDLGINGPSTLAALSERDDTSN